MQNLFALEVTPQGEVVMAGECFVQRKVPTELGTEFLQLEEEERTLRHAAAPPMHMIIAFIALFGVATCFFVFSMLQGEEEPTLDAVGRLWPLVVVGGVFLLVGIVATVLRKKEISLSEEWWAERKTYTSPPRKGHVRRGRYGYGLRSHYAVQICTAKGEFELIVAPWSIGALAAVADLKPVAA